MNSTKLKNLVDEYCFIKGHGRIVKETMYLDMLEQYMDDEDYFWTNVEAMEKEVEEAEND